MTPPVPRGSLQVLAHRRRQLVQRSQAQRAALAAAGAGAAGRLRWIDGLWRVAVWLGRHPGALALPALAWGWWAARRARRVAPPQSGAGDRSRR